MARALKWIAITLAVVVVVPLVLLIIINLFDEDLDPRAAAYGEPRAATIPEAENAYFAMIALNASDGADGIAYARAWHKEVKTAAQEKRKEKLPESKRAKRQPICDPRQTACLAELRAKSGEVAQQLDAYKEDLARYDAMLNIKRYEDVIDFQMRVESSIPPYFVIAGSQSAYLLRTGMDIEAGKLEEAITALERDLAFQRLLLGNSRTLIGKMVGTANLWRTLQFVSELVQVRQSELAPFLPRLRKWLGPLDAAALNLTSTMETEFGLVKTLFRDGLALKEAGFSVPVEEIATLFFFKRNASMNRSYRYYSGMGAVLGLPADRLESEASAFTAQWNPEPQWDWVYNPVGKILQGVAAPTFQEYGWRLHDLDALSRLLALRTDMLAAGVNADQAQDFIAKSDAALHNPYTRKPMNWDAEKKRIYFPAKSTGSKRFKQGVDGNRVYVLL